MKSYVLIAKGVYQLNGKYAVKLQMNPGNFFSINFNVDPTSENNHVYLN